MTMRRFTNRVYRAIHPEFKLETGFVSTNMGLYDGAATVPLNVISQNTGLDGRTGNKVCIKMLKIRMQVSMNGTNTADFNQYRILLVKVKPADGEGIPSLENILNFNNSGGNHMYAFRQLDTVNKFKIIKDTYVKRIGVVGAVRPCVSFSWYIKQNTVCTYGSNDGDAGDVTQNLYVLYAFADQGENYPVWQVDYNVRYLDC